MLNSLTRPFAHRTGEGRGEGILDFVTGPDPFWRFALDQGCTLARMFKPLSRKVYEPSARLVAPALLGHWLIRNTPEGPCGGPIVETEAYVVGDPACHAYVGRTARNRVMWGDPGVAYVYLIYGNHFCVNAVCGPEGIAEAVLIRAVEASLGRELMLRNRPVTTVHELTSGPGKLCAALDVTRALDGADLCDPKSPLFIAKNHDLTEFLATAGPPVTTKRIGITKAAHLALRFYLPGSPFLSRKHMAALA